MEKMWFLRYYNRSFTYVIWHYYSLEQKQTFDRCLMENGFDNIFRGPQPVEGRT